MPFPDATFDAVTSLDLIEHLERPEDFLLEMGRVLKPNGFGIIVAPNILSPFRPFKYLLRCMTGKRGLPGFYENPVACLRFSAWAAGLLLWKRLGPLPAFRYREPTLSEAQETDEDCMYYANPVDISRHLASWGYHRIKYQGEGQTAGRRLLARLAPDFAGIINIVYRKQG